MTTCAHEPDMSTVTLEWDGDEVYIDVACRHCGRSGCFGKLDFFNEVDWGFDCTYPQDAAPDQGEGPPPPARSCSPSLGCGVEEGDE